MTVDEIIEELRALSDPAKIADLERYAIKTPKWFGIRAPEIKAFAREVKRLVPDRHGTALELWKSGIYDVRAVAFLIDDPKRVTPEQMPGARISTTGQRLTGRAVICSVGRRLLMKKRSTGPSASRNSRSAPVFR